MSSVTSKSSPLIFSPSPIPSPDPRLRRRPRRSQWHSRLPRLLLRIHNSASLSTIHSIQHPRFIPRVHILLWTQLDIRAFSAANSNCCYLSLPPTPNPFPSRFRALSLSTRPCSFFSLSFTANLLSSLSLPVGFSNGYHCKATQTT